MRRGPRQDTGFVDCSRAVASSSYHERMVVGRTRARTAVALVVMAAILIALVCVIVVSGGDAVW